jgi:hypothetical protein
VSNSLAIATVTAVMRNWLQAEIRALPTDVSGGTDIGVTTARPSAAGTGLPKQGVNLYLYQVTPNAALRNQDLPARRADGGIVMRPQMALDLHYLISFYGDDNKGEPQRLLGIVLRLLHTWPVLTQDAIRKFIASIPVGDPFVFLKTSNLPEAFERIRFTPAQISLDELSKIWSIFFQTSYALSTVYRGSVVIVEGEESAQPAPPVRSRAVVAIAASPPVVDRVASAGASSQPIVAGSALEVRGRALRGDATSVLVDNVEAPLLPADVRADEIVLALPAATLAGAHALQVVHKIFLGSPPAPHRGVESNVALFLVHPVVLSAVTSGVSATTPHSGTLTVTTSPPVGRGQRAIVYLDHVDAAQPRSVELVVASRPESAPVSSPTLEVPFARVASGTYSVRLQIDGAPNVIVAPATDYRTVTLP